MEGRGVKGGGCEGGVCVLEGVLEVSYRESVKEWLLLSRLRGCGSVGGSFVRSFVYPPRKI